MFKSTDRSPRIVTLAEPPIPELPPTTVTPAILPANWLTTLVSRATVKFSPFNSWDAYPNFFFSRLIPSAVTTTSSNASILGVS